MPTVEACAIRLFQKFCQALITFPLFCKCAHYSRFWINYKANCTLTAGIVVVCNLFYNPSHLLLCPDVSFVSVEDIFLYPFAGAGRSLGGLIFGAGDVASSCLDKLFLSF